MPAAFVVVHLPATGSPLAEAVARHPKARATAVPKRHGGSWWEFLALVEGLTDEELARVLLAWNRCYGLPADVIGESFALRLPVAVDRAAPGTREILNQHDLPLLGMVAAAGWAELWFQCESAKDAQALATRLRNALGQVVGAEVHVQQPRLKDRTAWEVLQFAAQAPVEAEGMA